MWANYNLHNCSQSSIYLYACFVTSQRYCAGSGRWQAWLVAAFLVAETVSLTSSSLPPVLTVYGVDGKPCILMAATLQLSYVS